MADKHFDLITMGRVSMDLFSQNVGAPFEEIEGFDASVGGSPTNIAIGASRLGLNVALLTAVGADEVGKFVLYYLQNAGVEIRYIPHKPDTRTGLAILGIQPPDKFPLVFYRENPADIHITIDDVLATPIPQSRVLSLSGTALSRGSCRTATLFAAEYAQANDVITFMDLDLRPDQWTHPQGYGINIRSIIPHLDVIIGTEEEFYAALAADPKSVMRGEPLTVEQQEELDTYVKSLLSQVLSPDTLVVKQGARGVSVFGKQGEVIKAGGFPADILNTVGAGDAFASGLIYGYLKGWEWYKCARMANACGALVVTRHGCAAALPFEQEVIDFVAERGGF